MDLGLRDKTAIVTGASHGLGRAIADALAAEGVKLVVCARTRANIERVGSALAEAHQVAVHPLSVDLSTREGVARCVAFALERLGHIDILVNSAGGIPVGTIDSIDDETWVRSFDGKLWGYIRMCRALLPHMRDRRRGTIINVVGLGGLVADPLRIAKGTGNAGLLNFTKALGMDCGRYGIRVNAINPGMVLADPALEWRPGGARQSAPAAGGSLEARIKDIPGVGQSKEELERWKEWEKAIPLRRIGRPEELAAVAAFLASDAASYVHGAFIPVDGGMDMSHL